MKKYLLLTLLILGKAMTAQPITTVFNESLNTSCVAKKGNYLYIGTSFDGIFRVDLSQTNPSPEAYLPTLTGVQDFHFLGDDLYITRNLNPPFVDKVIKVNTSLTNPPIEEVVDVVNVEGITIHDNTLYVSAVDAIYTYNLLAGSPLLTLLANDLATNFGTVGLAVTNGQLYVSDNSQLVKYDLSQSNPQKVIVGTVSATLTGVTNGETANILYATSYGGDMVYKIDVDSATFTNITPSGLVTNWGIAYDNDFLYVSSLEGGEVVRIDEDLFLGTDEQVAAAAIVYPNPVGDILHVNHQIIKIVDITGKSHEMRKVAGGLDISSLPSGTYIIYLEHDGVVSRRKIIKK